MTVSTPHLLIYIALMAVVTYLIRAIPLALMRRKIRNRFIRSFLYYIPYGVLTAMVIPAVFTATANLWSAVAGLCIAVLLALRDRSLLTVALSSCLTVFIVEALIRLF